MFSEAWRESSGCLNENARAAGRFTLRVRPACRYRFTIEPNAIHVPLVQHLAMTAGTKLKFVSGYLPCGTLHPRLKFIDPKLTLMNGWRDVVLPALMDQVQAGVAKAPGTAPSVTLRV
jgi:hypothetical protein